MTDDRHPRDRACADQTPRQFVLPIALPAAEAKDAKIDVRGWLQLAARAWAEEHEREMTVRWARDLAILKPLLRQHGSNELAARWCAYIATADPFLARRGWDVPTFSTCVDRYASSTDRAELIGLRNLRPIRDPYSGAVLGRRRGW